MYSLLLTPSCLQSMRFNHLIYTILTTSFDSIHWYDEAIHKIRNKSGQYTYEKLLHHYDQRIVNERLFWAITLAKIKKMS